MQGPEHDWEIHPIQDVERPDVSEKEEIRFSKGCQLC